jgi:hypothetical protein
MRLVDGRYQCVLCGVILHVPTETEPQVVIKSLSGKPHMRTISYEGVEIHACPVGRARRGLE